MLTAAQLEAEREHPTRRKRTGASLTQQYQAYVMQRIEDYKDSLSRQELLALGDLALRELHSSSGQLLLTEVLMQETVDQYIVRRLNLPPFRKWRNKIHPLREAQQDPTHWQIEQGSPVAAVLPRLEPGDRALVVGGGAAPAPYLLAAHDVEVTCLFENTGTADKVEDILSTESLSGRCSVYVALLGHWLPPIADQHLVVVDARAVLGAPRDRQDALMAQLQAVTTPEGLHALVSPDPAVAAESCLRHYPDWQRHGAGTAAGKGRGLGGVLLSGPPARAVPQSAYARPAV
ncbi:MAG: hypothetical protein AB7R55_17405 [Gemmatimonadales bacterium]